jgi:hypothetical protein
VLDPNVARRRRLKPALCTLAKRNDVGVKSGAVPGVRAQRRGGERSTAARARGSHQAFDGGAEVVAAEAR